MRMIKIICWLGVVSIERIRLDSFYQIACITLKMEAASPHLSGNFSGPDETIWPHFAWLQRQQIQITMPCHSSWRH